MCAVCCVAMATGSTTEDVYQFLNDGRVHGDPICSADEAMFLLSKGWLRGTGFIIPEGAIVNEFTDLALRLDGMPAMLDVESRNVPGVEHAIFWDGQELRDPDPRVGETSGFSQYKILRIWPLCRVMETHYCKRIKLDPRPTPSFVIDHRNGMYTNNYDDPKGAADE